MASPATSLHPTPTLSATTTLAASATKARWETPARRPSSYHHVVTLGAAAFAAAGCRARRGHRSRGLCRHAAGVGTANASAPKEEEEERKEE
ncbi:hypothetical protein AK812_SmicGene11853 [Symbiodinium microadriaticum]|uniref:Uncharacterized protein n=1 Tax=Symbiodinium microadriaticum TaxID=2951 RepID=A0A1Q9EC87_SYMMI|nr:hypothetical protein AK812_SmicGene11853 [Symbiodinium microadriaticum]